MKPPYEESITILNDEKMREKGFTPLSLDEKTKWVSERLEKIEKQLINLKKERFNIDDPTLMPTIGDNSPKAKRERSEREDKLTPIDRRIERIKIAIKEHRLRLDKYQKLQRDQQELNDTQIGRPEDFPKENTKKWHFELKQKPKYQHGNGKPYLKEIRKRIRELHEKDTGFKPSVDTIKDHYRKLGLTRDS